MSDPQAVSSSIPQSVADQPSTVSTARPSEGSAIKMPRRQVAVHRLDGGLERGESDARALTGDGFPIYTPPDLDRDVPDFERDPPDREPPEREPVDLEVDDLDDDRDRDREAPPLRLREADVDRRRDPPERRALRRRPPLRRSVAGISSVATAFVSCGSSRERKSRMRSSSRRMRFASFAVSRSLTSWARCSIDM